MNNKYKVILIFGIIFNLLALVALGFQSVIFWVSFMNPLFGFFGFPATFAVGFGVLVICFIGMMFNFRLYSSEYKTIGTMMFTINVALIVLAVLVAIGGPMYFLIADRLNALNDAHKSSSSIISSIQ